jgi:hypothetical protein
MSLNGLECPVPELANSDACPRPTTQGLYEHAGREYERSALICEEIGQLNKAAHWRTEIVRGCRKSGHGDEGIVVAKANLPLAKRTGDKRVEATLTLEIALTYDNLSQHDVALRWCVWSSSAQYRTV